MPEVKVVSTTKQSALSDLKVSNEQAKGAARDQFNKLDTNGDGKLDLAEFTVYMAQFGLTTAESVTAFKAWDLDASEGITIDEFENLMGAVLEIQLAAIGEAANAFTAEFGEKPEDLAKWYAFGCCCCLCTAGLSCCPIYCKLKAIQAKMAKKDKPLAESNLDDSSRKLKAKLLAGPLPEPTHPIGQMMTRDEEAV